VRAGAKARPQDEAPPPDEPPAPPVRPATPRSDKGAGLVSSSLDLSPR
jgi:hypothetical protein